MIHAHYQQRWNGPLDEWALSRYERDGFLWFDDFFSEERIEPFFDELCEIERDPALASHGGFIRDPDSGELRSVFAMHEISERFSKLTRDPRILGMARQLLGGDVYIHQSRINDKVGFAGSGFNWHSDFETWHSEDGMPRMRAVSFSLMLTDNNEFNGPLMLIPGSHQYFVPCVEPTPEQNWRRSLQVQQIGVPEAANLRWLANRGGVRAPKGKPGSLLLFECNTMHASNRNMSPWPRANLFFVYNSIENSLVDPFCGHDPRPEFLAARQNVAPLQMLDEEFKPIALSAHRLREATDEAREYLAGA